jgi:hypothetical protein
LKGCAAVAETREFEVGDPMPFRLTVNRAVVMRGTLQQVQGTVAELTTTWLAAAPEELAADVQTVHRAFTSGDVERELSERGKWFTMVGVHTTDPHSLKVTREE